jgi:hypothetical protein
MAYRPSSRLSPRLIPMCSLFQPPTPLLRFVCVPKPQFLYRNYKALHPSIVFRQFSNSIPLVRCSDSRLINRARRQSDCLEIRSVA